MSRLKPFASPLLILSLGIAMTYARPVPGQDEPPPKYVGVSKCAQCHDSEGTGRQVTSWRQGPHGKAWEMLKSEAAVELAKSLGVDDPSTAPECLRCHTTGAGLPKGSFAKGFDHFEGVQCESCHGPGEHYAKIEHMIMSGQAKNLGLIEPSARVCVQCHNDKSPTFKGFDYREAVKKITHALAPY